MEIWTVDDFHQVIEEFNGGGESMIRWNNEDEILEFDLDTLEVTVVTKE